MSKELLIIHLSSSCEEFLHPFCDLVIFPQETADLKLGNVVEIKTIIRIHGLATSFIKECKGKHQNGQTELKLLKIKKEKIFKRCWVNQFKFLSQTEAHYRVLCLGLGYIRGEQKEKKSF